MRFADVILPLPVKGDFTYRIPDDFQEKVKPGCRVFVQFGSRKFYTGIVRRIHSEEPEDFSPKEIMMLLEETPSVRPGQIKFWDWLADYYLCTTGEVYKAAVPSGLKIESESYVSLRDDFEGEVPVSELSEKEIDIIQRLETKGKHKFSEISTPSSQRVAYNAVNSLISKGIISIDEQAVSSYRPKRETFVSLADGVSRRNIEEMFSKVSRSEKQERLLLAFLDIARKRGAENEWGEVGKKKLLEAANLSTNILKALTDKGILKVYKKEINRFREGEEASALTLPELTATQSEAMSAIKREFGSKNTVLLHGVTGSGKTEIYIRLIAEALEEGKQVLYLVPEISLTTQLTSRLRKVFGSRLLIYHSKFSDNERVDIWKRLIGEAGACVVLGVRSSVFLPFANPGLVIVDEEHESSYKQYDPAPRYNARDAAIVLASMYESKTLLGSATPSVETYFKAENGRYGLVTLSERFAGTELPEVKIVDMRRERKRKENRGILSSELYNTTKAALAAGDQAIMFQNRRGFSPVVVCKECGWVPKCRNCDVSLVYHKSMELLRCHYCGYSYPLPALCPACGTNSIEIYGYGTERIAEDLAKEFPQSRIARMDLDTTRNKDAYQQIIDSFSRHETDILTGTQMVSKGLDFANVSIVGVMNADTMLHFPDFRSQERAFNMLVQVAGRAGRRKQKGEVIIQTSDPGNDTLAFVKKHDYAGFYRHEIAERQKFGYPPFRKVIMLYLKHRDAAVLDRIAVNYTLALKATFGDRVLGPEKPLVGRISNYYLQSVMLKIESGASMKKVKDILRKIYENMVEEYGMKGVILYYDVDPA